MRLNVFIFLLLISSAIFGQEIGTVYNGNYSLKLLKVKHHFEIVYSDIGADAKNLENSFKFSNKESFYDILMEGFAYSNDHQVIVLSDKETVVKFNFRKVAGEVLFYLNHHNLKDHTMGKSTFYKKEHIKQLFGNP